MDTQTLWLLTLIVCTSISGMIGQFQQHYLTRSLFREERMQGNLGQHASRVFRSEYKQHLLSLKFKDKSLEKKYVVTRWRETVLTCRKFSAFLVLNAAIIIIYEYFWKFNDLNIVMYRCLFHLLPQVVLVLVFYYTSYSMSEELSKRAVRVAWLYSAVREKVVNRYRLTQVFILLVFLSSISVYLYLTPVGIDAPFETVLMLIYLQLCTSTRIGTSYFILGTSILLVQSLALSFIRPDASNYVVSIIFTFINALLYIRLTTIKRRKLFIFESSEQNGLFTQLDGQGKSIETISMEYRQGFSTLKRKDIVNLSSSNSSSSDSSYNFLENVLSLYSDTD